MHVGPDGLRAVRQGGIVIRFALLGPMAYVLAEVPEGGSAGTALEHACTTPHWGIVIDGELTYVSGEERQAIPAGRAFHVPSGSEHHFEATGATLIAGFQPVDPALEVSDAWLAERGFEPATMGRGAATVVPVVRPDTVRPGEIKVESWRMSSYVMARVRMGERSGYTSGWCDAPHWGVVTAGRLAIEWEDDVEILTKGDIFCCPAGPPGHRVEAADPVTFVDLTPLAALDGDCRLVDWRRDSLRSAHSRGTGIAVAALG